MERLFLECAVRAALLVGATAFVLYTMRVRAATARHSVWSGVVALMLLLPIWTAWGPKAPLRVLPPLPQSIANKAKAPIEIFSTGVLRSRRSGFLKLKSLGTLAIHNYTNFGDSEMATLEPPPVRHQPGKYRE